MPSLQSLLKDVGTMRKFHSKSPVIFQGEIPREVYIVLDGIVRAYAITGNGEERVVGLYGKGDVFPLSWTIGTAGSALFYYSAVSESRVLAVKKHDFDNLLTSNPGAVNSLLDLLGREYTGLMFRITSLVQSKTLEKLAYTLYYLSLRYGIARGNDMHLINFSLNQTMLANLIGQTREGTARNLKQLVEKEIVNYSGSDYTVNHKRLLDFLGEDSMRDLTP